jgi:hypothetical protein
MRPPVARAEVPVENEDFAQWERKAHEGCATDRDNKTWGMHAQATINHFVAERNVRHISSAHVWIVPLG